MVKDSQRPKELTAYAPLAAPRDIGEALAAVSEDDMLRLRAIARLRARSAPGGVSWSDLLHEAVVRALAGMRPWPPACRHDFAEASTQSNDRLPFTWI